MLCLRIDDVRVIKMPYPACADQDCEVHKGFYLTYMQVRVRGVAMLPSCVCMSLTCSLRVL